VKNIDAAIRKDGNDPRKTLQRVKDKYERASSVKASTYESDGTDP